MNVNSFASFVVVASYYVFQYPTGFTQSNLMGSSAEVTTNVDGVRVKRC